VNSAHQATLFRHRTKQFLSYRKLYEPKKVAKKYTGCVDPYTRRQPPLSVHLKRLLGAEASTKVLGLLGIEFDERRHPAVKNQVDV
jgi:hypothetical protein